MTLQPLKYFKFINTAIWICNINCVFPHKTELIDVLGKTCNALKKIHRNASRLMKIICIAQTIRAESAWFYFRHCLSVIYLILVTHAATAGNEVKIVMSRYACEVALKRERSQLSREEGVSY
jgi:hypothetical protein